MLCTMVQHTGDRAFVAAGPGLWNSLPSPPKEADLSFNRFRRSLLAKDIFVWIVRTRYSVNYFNCAM